MLTVMRYLSLRNFKNGRHPLLSNIGHRNYRPQDIIDAYNLTALVDNQGWIYMRIKKGMYGIKQAGIIANQELVKHMAPFEYHPVQHTPGLWVHDNRQTIFSLVVDDFVFNIPQQRMPNIFKIPQIQIPHHSQHGSGSLHWN